MRVMVLKSGALLNVWMAFGMPVVLTQHLLIHIPLTLLMFVATGWPSCRELIQSTEAVDKISLLNDHVTEYMIPLFSGTCVLLLGGYGIGVDRPTGFGFERRKKTTEW